MNKYLYFLLLPLCMGMVACGSDDDDNGSQTNIDAVGGNSKQNNNLSDAAKKFLGYWHNNNGSVDFLFNADGTCKSYSPKGWSSYEKSGVWSYDEKTNVLATTIESYQWTVTISTDQAWSGLGLGGNNAGAQSFVRSDLYYCWCVCLSKYNWVSQQSAESLDFLKGTDPGVEDTRINLNGRIGKGYTGFGFAIYPDQDWFIGRMEAYAKKKSNDYYGSGLQIRNININYNSASMTIGNCKLSNGCYIMSFKQQIEGYGYFDMYEWVSRDNNSEWEFLSNADFDVSISYSNGTITLMDIESMNPRIVVKVDSWSYKPDLDYFMLDPFSIEFKAKK